MIKTELIYPGKKHFNNRYLVSRTGRVFNKATGKELNYHNMPNGGKFVRLCGGKQRVISISVAKAVLLAYNPNGYKKDKIAVHEDGDIFNNVPSNLKWGTREDVAIIAMENPDIKKRVSKMAKKYYDKLKRQRNKSSIFKAR